MFRVDSSRRWLAMLAGAWTLILAPALCTAGVLLHLCPCEDEVACEHEADCSADPCSELAVRQPDGGGDADLVAAHAAVPVPALLTLPPTTTLPLAPRHAPPRAGLPYPPGDLPLRI